LDQYQKDQILNEAAQDIALTPPQNDFEEQVVVGLSQAELAGRVQNAAEGYNLAQDLDEETLQSLGKEVWEGFDEDQKSRVEWMEDHAFWLSLYMQKDASETQDPERSWGATESVPILTESCDQFQSRTYKIFFPNDTFISAIPMRKNVQDRKALDLRAEKIGRHMSYQLGYQDRSFRMDKDALFLGVAVHGSFFTKTYFSQKKKRFQVDNVRPTDLVVNYHVGPVRMEDLRRKTHIIYSTVGTTEALVKDNFFIEPAKAGSTNIDEEYNLRVNDVQGLTPSDSPSIRRDAQAVLLEQHGYYDLEGNGEYRPYIATICAASHKLLRLTIGYEADDQGNPLKDYEQIQYFTHYKYAENPDGFYGLGLGHKIGDLNAACNIMLRQTMDAATLANDGNMSGFVSEQLGLEGDDIRAVLGRLRKIPASVGDLTNSIMMMKFPGPNAALMEIMTVMDQRAQRMGAITEATTGDITAQTAQPTTVLAQIEQALEQFSSVQMRLANSFSEELQKIYRINQKYLPLVDYYVVNGDPEAVTRADYADDMLIQPVFDPKYATQNQKVQRAQAVIMATLQNPVNQSRPEVIDEAFRRGFEAMDIEDIDALVPPQPQIENFDDQRLENMFLLMPPGSSPLFDVFPTQNHAQHLMLMADLEPFMQGLLPEQLDAITKHQLKHQAYLYGQTVGVVPPPQPESLPVAPLAARSGDGMGIGGIAQEMPGSASIPGTQDAGASVSGGGAGGGF
jgi:chaperonin GroES